MNFITSYYWQQAEGCENTTALLLLQSLCKKGDFRIVLACICAGKYGDEKAGILSAYITEQIQNWFYEREFLLSGCKKKKELKVLTEGLKVFLFRLDKELQYGEKLNLCGFLCVDDKILFFCRGNMRIYMLNRRFGQDNIRCLLEKEEKLALHTATIQSGVGIIVATDDLYNRFSQKSIAECLSVSGIVSQKQADKHLRELCISAEQRGGVNIGAILLLTSDEYLS